jgi:transcriptional regulator GlxA family with amidase domain
MTKTVGIVLFDGVEELDAVGPWEVLSAWKELSGGNGWNVVTASRTGGTVACAKGLTIQPACALSSAPPFDVVIYPGGRGTRPLTTNEAELDWVRNAAAGAEVMASVCTGALVYAAAGLLRNRPATTHWAAFDELAALDPSVELRPDVRFVDDGDVVTAAGVSAGIDMALHLVARLAGPDRARDVRRYIQYDPAPPV